MDRITEIVPVRMANGKVVQVQVTGQDSGLEDIAISDHLPSFGEITDAVEEISKDMLATLDRVKPNKASVEFGLEAAIQEGKLTALLVQGSGTASIKVTLEWGNE